MQLQLEYINIIKIEFAAETRVEDGVLYINREQILEKFQDSRLKDVDIQITLPGESCRITHVGDVIEPRVKVDNCDATFPGTIGFLQKAGNGVTRVLRGVAIMECYQLDLPQGSFVDMSGPGADYSEFSKTKNIVVSALPVETVDRLEYTDALKELVLSLSRYFAELTIDLPADEMEQFEMVEKEPGCALPRVAYLHVLFSHKRNCEPLLYGNDCHGILPTIVHPNEILDGALVNRNYEQMSNSEPTYNIQNHALIKELYARDGVDIDFVGVILVNSYSNNQDKIRSALMASTLAKYSLHADLAVITKEGGGHPQLDIAFCCDELAKYGIGSVLIITELMAITDSVQESIIFNTPNANTIVSSGKYEEIDLPAVDRVIGGDRFLNIEKSLVGPITLPNRHIRGSLGQIGGSMVTSIIY